MDDSITCSLGAMGPLLAQLHSLTDTERSLPQGISKDELQGLIQDLEEINSSVMDLAKEEDPLSTDKFWMKEVREICYDAEDYLATVMHAGARNRIAQNFSEFRARLKDENERHERCVLADLRAQKRRKRYKPDLADFKTIVESVLQAPNARPDEPMNELVSLLAFDSRDQKLKVVPIFGSPGVGKTTLARRLYHQYGGRFQCRAFLRVSRNPDPRRLLTSMLLQIKGPRHHSFCDVQDLTDNINKHLQGKTYLIIVDDLWDASVWDIFRHAFPTGNGCSRIITTTQIEVVAFACCSYYSENIYNMRPPSNYDQSRNLEEVIDLIYNDLPSHLKTCLLYLSIYPEDYTIRKDDLVKQWVAEGFIRAEVGKDIEEVAAGYFGELVTKGMILPADTNDNDEVVSCTVHHMVLDFITYKSMEENFVTIVDYFEAVTGLPDKVRRLSMKFGGAKGAEIQGSLRMSQVRSLIFFGFFECVPPIVGYKLVRVLILHIWTDQDTSFDLGEICELFQLRYLKIECNMTVKLPTNILGLKYLETLEINARVTAVPSDIVDLQRLLHLLLPSEADLPNRIGCMTSLRSLGYFNLSTSSRENVLDLGKLTKLRDLHITFCTDPANRLVTNMEFLASILGECSSLKSLVLDGGASSSKCISCDDLGSMSTPPAILERLELSRICIFSSLPRWIEKLNKLCVLKIALENLSMDDINILKGLKALAALSLYVRTAPAKRIVFHKEGFPVLKHFKFICFALCLAFEKGAMPNVRRLKIGFDDEGMEQYSLADAGLENLTGLEVLSAKIGCAGAAESGSQAVESALYNAFSSCLSRPVINVLSVDWFFHGDKEMSVVAQTEQSQTLGKADVIIKGGSGKKHRTGEKGFLRDINIQADSRITLSSELPSQTQISGKYDKTRTQEKKDKTREKQDEILEEYSDARQKVSGEDRSKRTDSRSPAASEPSSYMQSEGLKQWRELAIMDTGAMVNLTGKLTMLHMDEFKLEKGMMKQVRSILMELESIHTALHKVAEVPSDQLNKQVKVWAREVKEVLYDMEDILDTSLMRFQLGQESSDSGMLKRAMKKIGDLFSKGKAHHDIVGAIQDIAKQLQVVAEWRARYKVDENLAVPAARTSTDPRLAAMYNEVTQLIGIDKPRGELISMLSRQRGYGVHEKKMKKISVVGVGGLGKTTLAKAVYDKLKGNFSCGAFVPVGQNPDLKKVFKDILIDLDKQHFMRNLNMTILDIRQLIEEIREFLKYNSYFIVVDDIWEIQSWETIKLALVENNCGSTIITTTRNHEVAEGAGKVYELQPLSYDNSKILFYTRIFGGEGKCLDNQPDEISDKVLKKCDGIPLAIITMASLFVGKPREEWCELYSAIGFGHKDNRHVKNTMRILSLGYYDLPSHLKTCLLYLSAFPEDYVIEKNPLIWKWIAEGFVHEKQGKLSLFELGEGYFNDLLNRSMIQAVDSEWDGIVEGCRVHQMILDLIRSLSCEENFFTILDNVEGTLSQSKVRTLLQSKVRRLAHQNITIENNTHQADHMDMPQVRSYIASKCYFSPLVLLSSFKLLRVLAIENCQFGEDCHLENLGSLLHLRYLGLSGTNIYELPKEIGDLKFLQILDVQYTAIKELSARVVLLTQLVCLRADLWRTTISDGIGKLTSLEELRILAGRDKSKRQFVKELGNLRELRVLQARINGLMDESQQRELVESLCNLHKIQHLELYFNDIVDADIATWEAAGFTLPRHLRYLALYGIEFSRLPSCINPAHLPNLTTLELCVVSLDERDLKLLGRLTELRYLHLKSESTVTVSNINASDGCFQKLRVFTLPDSMVQFERNKEDSSVSLHIWNGFDAMPSFKCSIENDCSHISSAVMPNLQVLSTNVFVRALKDGNGDCDNIIGLEYLTSLRKVTVSMNCDGASAAEVEEAEAALRNKTDVHPNRPTLEVIRYNDDEMRRRRGDLADD